MNKQLTASELIRQNMALLFPVNHKEAERKIMASTLKPSQDGKSFTLKPPAQFKQ